MDITAASAAARRLTESHRKEGSGRVSTNRPVELAGSRSGWMPPRDVEKDEHGMDDVDQFMDLNAAGAPGAGAGACAPRAGAHAPDSRRLR